MMHPKNKAERRRIDKRKKKINNEREELVQSRLQQELEETKEAIRQLGFAKRNHDKQEELDWHC